MNVCSGSIMTAECGAPVVAQVSRIKQQRAPKLQLDLRSVECNVAAARFDDPSMLLSRGAVDVGRSCGAQCDAPLQSPRIE